MALRLRRGTNTQRTGITPQEGELIYVTDYSTAGVSPLYVGDGTTVGGNVVASSGGGGGLSDIVNDTTPQLGGNMSLNGFEINGTGDIDITGNITASGTVNANAFVGNITGNVTGNASTVTNGVVTTGSYSNPSWITQISGDKISGSINIGASTSVTSDSFVGNLTGNVAGNVTGTHDGVVGGTTPAAVTGTTITANTNFAGNLVGNITPNTITYANNLAVNASTVANTTILYSVTGGYVQDKIQRTDTGSASGNQLGLHNFEQIDASGTKSHNQMGYWSVGTYMGQSTTGTYTASNFVSNVNGNLVIGEYAPTAGYRLDVRGNAKIVGELVADSIKGSLVADDSTILVDGVAGKVNLAPNVLNELSNVSTTAPSVNQVLKWTRSQWAPSTDAAGSGAASATISGATQATPGVITTTAGHNFTNGAKVTITNVVGMVELNGNDYYANVLTSTTFSLYSDASLSTAVNTTGFTAYGSAGTATQAAGTDATTLGGLAGSHYLDYTNATNKPTISTFALTMLDDAAAGDVRTTLGLGTAAEKATGFFATSAQGTKADSAVQPAALGSYTFTGSTLDTSDSSGITITVPVITSSDLATEGNLTVSGIISGNGSGITGISGLSSRGSVAASTGNVSDDVDTNINITGYKGYMLYKIQTDAAAWVRIYTSAAKRTADAARAQGADPGNDSGVIAEVITTGADTVIIAPGVIGFNDESVVTNVIPCAVKNKSGGTANITVTLTAVEMEI